MRLSTFMTRSTVRQVLKFKKQSPHVFFTIGVVGTVASTVLACRATLKVSDTLDAINGQIKDIEELKSMVNNDSKLFDNPKYNKDDLDRDIVVIYAKAGYELTKLYGPAILVGAASITLLTGSHIQMSRRNAALMAAYTAVQEAYENYRERVRAQVGDERELELYRGTSNEIVKVDGNNVEIEAVDPNKRSPYSRFFDEYSTCWEKDPELNRLFVTCQQTWANNRLHARGHVFLNEVYDSLGIERSKAGAIVGWVISKEGDNFVDFGIYELGNRNFVNGTERSILLDFNVDGVIYDKI